MSLLPPYLQVDDQILKAFELWSTATNLNFRPKSSGSVHIEIRFERKEHGDGDPFDGPGGTLAHAYFPQYGGDAHFDDQGRTDGRRLRLGAQGERAGDLALSHPDDDDDESLWCTIYKSFQSFTSKTYTVSPPH